MTPTTRRLRHHFEQILICWNAQRKFTRNRLHETTWIERSLQDTNIRNVSGSFTNGGGKTVNSFEDMSVAEDGRQFIISTTGVVTVAAGAAQGMGQMSDDTAQQILQHNSNTSAMVSALGQDTRLEKRSKASRKRSIGRH